MPQKEEAVVRVGNWQLHSYDTKSQPGFAKLYVRLPGELNALGRSLACTIVKSFGRVRNVSIRKGQLVIKLVVTDTPDNKLDEDVVKQSQKMLTKLNSEVKLRAKKPKFDHQNGCTPALTS